MGKKQKRNKKKKKIFKKILLILLIILLAAGGFIAYRTVKLGGGLQGFLAALVGHNELTLKELPKIRCLLLGESQGLTDTIMIAQYDPKTQQAALLSIPRDTFIGTNKNRATGSDKINAVAQLGVEETLIEINELTNLDIQYYVLIDTKALTELVDAIGGVWFNVPIDMKYDDYYQDLHINLKAGYQLLDGDKAEQLVRFRHNNDGSTYSYEYGIEDFGRVRTQREFISAAVDQTISAKNITKIGDFIDIAYNNIETNIPLSVLKDYVPYAVNFSTENLKNATLPGQSEKCNEIWLFIHNEEETIALIDELFINPQTTIEEQEEITNEINTTVENIDISQIRIEILNGSNEPSNLTELTEKLKKQGYNVVKAGKTETTAVTTITNKTNKPSNIEQKIKQIVGDAKIIAEPSNSANVDFTIIIGKDY